MIVTPVPGGLQLVTQPDHAHLAAEILALWRADGLPDHPRRADLLYAVREHDNGWREADAAPRLDPESRAPLDFRRMPPDERFAIWRRALDRLAETPRAQALVAHHALEIHRDRPQATWGAFRAETTARRDEALAAAGGEAAELEADYRHLELCDTISLAACGAFDHAVCRGHSIRRTAAGIELDPFPLAGATTFEIPVRRLGDGPWANSVELIGHLADARWQRQPVRLSAPRP